MTNTENHFLTKGEIEGQPDLWIESLKFLKGTDKIRDFLQPILKKKKLNIILTGAGTSAYVGEITDYLFRCTVGNSARSIPTTTLVTHFENYIEPNTPLLLISFARSGNSPESVAAVEIAQQYSNDVYHIALTCNKDGELAKKVSVMNNGYTILLPPKAEDQGLAMTGSFTSMLLASIYIAKECYNEGSPHNSIVAISKTAHSAIELYKPLLKSISFQDFNRIVFLGSGPLQGIAKESHLKVQELTDGYVVGKHDSFLGFRHGPKAVVNSKTILVFLFSSNERVFHYEKDLVKEILEEDIAMKCIGVFCNQSQADELDLEHNIVFDLNSDSVGSDYKTILYVLPAQIIGFYKSLQLGLNPDSPSQNNVISRVVKGVTIYPS